MPEMILQVNSLLVSVGFQVTVDLWKWTVSVAGGKPLAVKCLQDLKQGSDCSWSIVG